METGPKKPNTTRLSHWAWLWWLFIIGLMVWNVWALLPATRPEVNIPYTAFLAQVRTDNVSQVRISGDEISGSFVKSLVWPQPTESATSPSSSPTPLSATPSPTLAAATPKITSTALAAATSTITSTANSQSSAYSEFYTTFPQAVGDPTLMPLLEAHGVEVDVQPPPSPLFGTLLLNVLPMLLLVLLLVWMGRRATQGQAGVFGFGRSKPRVYTEERPKVTFDDVAGADEAKGDLQEIVDFLRHPEKYRDIGAHIPRGVLLVGPPGTGKTLMARAVAGEAEAPFFSISASEFVEMFVGVGAGRVRDLFEQAKAAAPAIIFIDEMDAVGRRRGAGMGAVNDEREQTLNQLLVEMDGFDERHEIIVLAATNRPDVLDPALLRPGRFDREIVVNLPDRRGREGILRIHTAGLRLAGDVDLALLARTTTGMSGADLANLCNEAALVAARHDRTHVSMADFEEAVDKVLLGGVRPLLLDTHERNIVAYHEAGHALVAWLTAGADPVLKVTIIPRGRTLGVTEQVPGEDHYNYSRSYLQGRLAVMLGGRSAEEIAVGDVTTGAENDLVEATRLARKMITRWGMGSLGLTAFQADEEQPFLGYELARGHDYSEATAALVDQDVKRLLQESHEAARQILTGARDRLDKLVETLLHEETVDEETLTAVLGPRPEPQPESAPAASSE